ncbi:gephyrin-like molybdotransferase Glp [Effusibacillus lacus]|uniref:Molybdopterin molybdenumtransferase n=1 Tax=Effusibacillus lacus TaxID=1348429 RepID=A0A292YJW6_9BACL|nr:gephyrin-like molybdotransferase Glp [Effusibacillus lacus]TCS74328.1 molybdopterin molybdochelatase [Effusibacillus lacus]GAX88785.1 molybdopterin molybdenumtransferase MoeA [Effusibacillus lacus]
MMRVGLTVEEAIREVLAHVKPVSTIEMPMKDAFGYTLAEDVTANAPVPSFDRSMMDGFAIRTADVQTATPETPVRLQVRGRIGAGQATDHVLQPGEAIRIMTGAPIPRGADGVARFEITDAQNHPEAEEVGILLPVREGESISLTGEDIAVGAKVLKKGTVIGAVEMALLATVGVAKVTVYRKPIIGVLSSGRELVGVEQPLSYGKIYNSNTYMLSGLISAWGGVPYLLDQVDDEVDDVVEAIRNAMPVVDALVTTGGVSIGDFDVMRAAYHLSGGWVNFWKVNMRPGTPFTFAVVQEKPVLGLSGNPAAGFVNAMLFVQPAIRAMAGVAQPETRPLQVVLAEDPELKVIGMDRFLRATVRIDQGQARAYPLPAGQSAGIISTLSGIQAFIRIPAKAEVKPGDLVEAYMLDLPVAGEIVP